MSTYLQHPSSFRDPSGFVFEKDEILYRQVNQVYARHFDLLIQSGLHEVLIKKHQLIPHIEINENLTGLSEHYKTIQPEFIQIISYPYEWSFAQLKDAALLTLEIMLEAIDHGMILKDATPYNIQFVFGRAVFIDTLSFEKYDESMPWTAYRQFCECFLNPLILAQYSAMPVSKIYQAYPDGIPADVTRSILPFKARFNLGNYLHIYLPASVNGKNSSAEIEFSKAKLLRIIQHLTSTIKPLETRSQKKSSWKNYYTQTILSPEYLEEKKDIVKSFTEDIKVESAIDLGSNDGFFSYLLAASFPVIAVDGDDDCISALHISAKKSGEKILPLCIDLINPPGESGWNNDERPGFLERVNPDLFIALALIHHLCIGKNLSFKRVVEFFRRVNTYLIIEFIPLEDEKVSEMIAERENIFGWYNQEAFENEFGKYFLIEKRTQVGNTGRLLYRMRKK